MNFWGTLTLYSSMITAAVVAGGALSAGLSWNRRHLHMLLSCSAGLMLGATVLHLIPESFFILGKESAIWILAGFLFLFVIEKFLTIHICELFECEVHSMGMSAVVGLSAHALTDGIALGSGLAFDQMGLVVFLSIFFHKLPEAFALTAILLHDAKRKRSHILFFNFLLVALVPLGAALVHLGVGFSDMRIAGIGLGFSAGTFLHVSLSDLLPHVHEHAERKLPVVVAFLIGLLLMVVLNQFI